MKLGDWVGGANLGFMLGLVLITALLVQFLPKLTKQVPSALIAIALGISFEQILRAASGGAFCTPIVGEVMANVFCFTWSLLPLVSPASLFS